MVEFILARYNYWIVIILMMTGLYIVFSRGNLVKTVVGLNLFQTSVFIFYITIGKVAGGTAPILVGGHGENSAHDSKNSDHGGNETRPDLGPTEADDINGLHGEAIDREALLNTPARQANGTGPVDTTEPLSREEAEAYVSGRWANEIPVNEPGTMGELDAPVSLHDIANVSVSNSLAAQRSDEGVVAQENAEVTVSVGAGKTEPDSAGHDAALEVAAAAVDGVVYSNPLPHVLILTAIVVGVATTAVGLAITVRIREAYGTIEEDELERLDNEAATGSPVGEGGTP